MNEREPTSRTVEGVCGCGSTLMVDSADRLIYLDAAMEMPGTTRATRRKRSGRRYPARLEAFWDGAVFVTDDPPGG